ncbi:hypothetical protein [Azospirillum sp. sgz301742]
MAQHDILTSSPRPHCRHCGDLILPGQPRWAGDPDGHAWHYACAEKANRTTRQPPLSRERPSVKL